MIYKVPAVWQMMGYLYVNAENEAEAVENAKKMAETCELPQNGEYLEDSFEIDEEGCPIPVL